MTATPFQLKALDKACQCLDRAKIKLEAMKSCPDMNEAAILWGEFLVEFNRVYLRLKKASETGPIKGWFDNLKNKQKTDPLLSYLLHARDVTEHGVEEVTSEGNHTISSDSGVMELVLDKDTNTYKAIKSYLSKSNIKFIAFHISYLKLVRVVDRSGHYDVPKEHMNKILKDDSPYAIGLEGIRFIENKIKEAKKLLL